MPKTTPLAIAQHALARLRFADAFVVREEGDGVVLASPEGMEPSLTAMARAAVEAALGKGKTRVVVDATLPKPAPAAPAPDLATPAAPPGTPPKTEKKARLATNVLMVASGKGGVGKSVIALNLARAMAAKGLQVGLLDADIHGPSLPTMLGLVGPADSDGNKLKPLTACGLKVMSMGFLVKPGAAMTWRGPMASSAALQTYERTDWGTLDVMILDAPPGTGDVHLTFAQKATLDGAIVVSTPHAAAIADAERALAMFARLNVPVLGVIENMAWLDTPTGERLYPFGKDGGKALAQQADVPLLGSLGFDANLAETPAAPTFAASATFAPIAESILLALVPRTSAGA